MTERDKCQCLFKLWESLLLSRGRSSGGMHGRGGGGPKRQDTVHPFWVTPKLHKEGKKIRLKPTEGFDRNCHRNKTIIFWSNGIESFHHK